MMSTCLTLLALLLGIFPPFADSQQNYYTRPVNEDCTNYHPENAGYVCDAATSSCDTVAYFRVQSANFASLDSIARIFNSTAAAIASASELSSADAPVSIGQGLYIPLTCTCYGNHSSQNVSYTVQTQDTFDKVANYTYEGLTTCQAIQYGNPTQFAEGLQIGQNVIIPIRCACPSTAQKSRGVLSLVTYPVAGGDSINLIIDKFGIIQQEFLTANNLSSSSAPLFYSTTVVLPFFDKPSIPPNATSSSSPPPITSTPSSSSSSKVGVYIGVSVAVVAALLFSVCIFCYVRSKKKKGELLPTSPSKHKPSFLPTKDTKIPMNLHEGLLDFPSSEKLATFTLEEIKQATQDFSPATRIKGAVYRGFMKGRLVAVKNVRWNVSKELQILRKVHHANLVTLLGSCIASPEQSYLVYTYAENGSLSDCLHNDNGDLSGSAYTLSWTDRLQVALDTATALEYIHDHVKPSYVHKDVKSSNILLDSKNRGKLANFTLAKATTDEPAVTRHIVGTKGYMAPEFLSQGVVSPKIDVFALGVVLLEILSGEEAVIRDEHNMDMFLSSEISKVLLGSALDGKERLRAWMDPRLQQVYPLDCAYSVALFARSCVSDDPLARPHMRDVAYTLAKALEISLEWQPSAVLENYSDNNALEAR